MINVFLLTDVEGIAGVDSITQMDRTSPEYENTRKLLSDSINKAVSACFEANADKVYYLDGHGGGGNVFEDLIDLRAQKCSLQEWVELLKSGSIDCQIELGAHAKAGTINGFLDHTINSKTIFSIKINGIEMCETSLHAALCGKFGVSVIAVIGDEAICRQVKDYIPTCFTCAVKNATERNIATTYPDADKKMRDTIIAAITNYKSVPPYQVSEPFTVEATYYRTDFCESAMRKEIAAFERIDARTLKKTVPVITGYGNLLFPSR